MLRGKKVKSDVIQGMVFGAERRKEGGLGQEAGRKGAQGPAGREVRGILGERRGQAQALVKTKP